MGIRLAPEEIEALEREAAKRKWSFSQYIREKALRGVLVETLSESGEFKAVGT